MLIALGSNVGPREWILRSAIHRLSPFVRVVRVSAFHETDPVDAPAGSPRFLNAVLSGFTHLAPNDLLAAMLRVEQGLGRVRRGRNAPRTLDLDLILYGATMMRTLDLTLPHPRYLDREFVRGPLRELRLPWCDPVTGRRLDA